jgi:hypothetical protein
MSGDTRQKTEAVLRVKNYAVGLEMLCPGGALLLGP